MTNALFASIAHHVFKSLRRSAWLVLALPVIAFPSIASAAPAMTLTVPAYFTATGSTAGDWSDLATTAAKLPTTAILNPDSGPGTTASAAYVAAIEKVHAAGGRVIGYVYTSYTQRSLSKVVADINTYVSLYKVDGFFIDNMTSDGVTSHLQYYQSIYNYIKGLSASYSVTANPGTNIPESYASLPAADQFVVFEDTAKHYASYAPEAWQAGYPASRFVHMVYSASQSQVAGIVQDASKHGAGSVYVTSLGLPNPYKALPSYWSQLVNDALAVK
jgi:hypothetical protein